MTSLLEDPKGTEEGCVYLDHFIDSLWNDFFSPELQELAGRHTRLQSLRAADLLASVVGQKTKIHVTSSRIFGVQSVTDLDQRSGMIFFESLDEF